MRFVSVRAVPRTSWCGPGDDFEPATSAVTAGAAQPAGTGKTGNYRWSRHLNVVMAERVRDRVAALRDQATI